MKLSLLVICAMIALLFPLLRMPALADADPISTGVIVNWETFIAQSTNFPDSQETPPPPLPYPVPEETQEPPYPEPAALSEPRHVTCIVVPWLTDDGWKKREVCYPNR